MTDCDTLQAAVEAWGAATFPHRTSAGQMRHLRREVAELAASAPGEEQQEEAADCFILLLHIAGIEGFSLFEAAVAKLAVCKRRTWGPPDAEGVVEHIR